MEEKDLMEQMAAEAFNRCWEYIDKPARTKADDKEMLTTALTQLELWERSGSDTNRARGHWQVSRVYALLENSEKSLYHAEFCYSFTEAAGLGDFDLVFAYEALARAHKLAGNEVAFRKYFDAGMAALVGVTEAEDREYCRTELESTR